MTKYLTSWRWLPLAIACLLLPGVAHAGDPVSTGVASAETAWDVWRTNGPLWGALVLTMVGLRTFLDRQHWILQGRLLAGLTGLAAIGTSVCEWQFGGAPAAGIATALMGALALITHPIPAASDPKVARPAGSPSIALLIIGGLAAAAVTTQVSACGAAQTTQTSRQSTLNAMTAVASTAIKSLEAYDQVAGDALVKAAADKPSAMADLQRLRSRVAPVRLMLQGVIDAIATGNALNDDHSLAGIQTALDQAMAAVVALTGGK